MWKASGLSAPGAFRYSAGMKRIAESLGALAVFAGIPLLAYAALAVVIGLTFAALDALL